MVRTELRLCLLTEEFLRELIECSLQICHCDSLVNNQSFNLMERWWMSCIYFVRTEYTSRWQNTDWQFALLHDSCLYRWCLCTKQNVLCDIECILLILCRMVCRNIQKLKVVFVIFNFRPGYDLISHTDKYTLQIFKRDLVWMSVSVDLLHTRKCNIDCLTLHLLCTHSRIDGLHLLLELCLDICTCLIYHLSNLRTILRSHILHALQYLG